MDHKKKQKLCKKDAQRSKKRTRLMRYIGIVCAVAFCLLTFAGCTEYVPLEEFEKLEKNLSSVGRALSAALQEIKDLETSNAAAKQEIEALKASESAAKQEIEALKASESAAKQEIEALKASNAEAAEHINALKASGAAAEAEIEALNTLIDTANGEIETLTESGNAAALEIEALKASIGEASAKIEALTVGIEEANQEIEALTESGNAAALEIEALKASNAEAEQKIAKLTDSGNAAALEIEALTAGIEKANQEIKALTESGDAASAQIEELKASNAAAAEEIEALKAELEEILANLPTEPDDQKIRIYIDQGHNPTGYHNAGATGNGLYEQDLTYAMGVLLATLLESDGRFEVLLSRPTEATVLGTDTTSSLEARVAGAKNFGADYFISLHVNSFDTADAHGIEVLVAEESGTSYDFGNALLAGMVGSTGLRDRGMKLRPELYVLKNAEMPAAIMEMGFISNPTDAAVLAQTPELFVEGIYNGILTYFALSPVTTAD